MARMLDLHEHHPGNLNTWLCRVRGCSWFSLSFYFYPKTTRQWEKTRRKTECVHACKPLLIMCICLADYILVSGIPIFVTNLLPHIQKHIYKFPFPPSSSSHHTTIVIIIYYSRSMQHVLRNNNKNR